MKNTNLFYSFKNVLIIASISLFKSNSKLIIIMAPSDNLAKLSVYL